MKFNPSLHKLSNGLCVALDPMDIETVYAQITFFTGGRDESPNEYGITHFCEHMLCKETTRFDSAKQRMDYLENNGGYSNASTSTKRLTIYGRIVAENLNILLDTFADQLQNKLFKPETIEKEKNIVIDELNRSLNNNSEKMSDFFDKVLFNWYVPNGQITLGNEDTIKSFTREQLFAFFNRRFSAKNCMITISGKIKDEKETLAYVEKLFSFLPNHDVSENTELKYTPIIAHNNQIKKDTIHVAVLFPDLRENTYENRLKNIALGYFEQYLSNELLNTVRFEKGLVYDITTDTFGNEKTGLNAIVTQTTPERIAEVVATMSKACLHVYQEKQITDEELQRYKNFDKLPMADFLENAKGRAKRITNFWHHYNRLYDFDKSKAETNSITVQNIIDASRGYFDGPMSIITQGADFDADLKQIWENNFKGDM